MQRIGWMQTDEFGWWVGNGICWKHCQTRDDNANSHEIIFMWSHMYISTSTMLMSHIVTSLLQPTTTMNQPNNTGHHHNTSPNDGAHLPSHHITPIPLHTNPMPEMTLSAQEGWQPPNKHPWLPNNNNNMHQTQPPQNDDQHPQRAPTTTTSTPHSPWTVNERAMWQQQRQ